MDSVIGAMQYEEIATENTEISEVERENESVRVGNATTGTEAREFLLEICYVAICQGAVALAFFGRLMSCNLLFDRPSVGAEII